MKRLSTYQKWRPKKFLLIFFLTVFVFANGTFSFAQTERVITGRVVDSEKQALPGVNVLIKGTTTGTITDADGAYIIKASGDDAILVFSFVGYITQEITVGSQSV